MCLVSLAGLRVVFGILEVWITGRAPRLRAGCKTGGATGCPAAFRSALYLRNSAKHAPFFCFVAYGFTTASSGSSSSHVPCSVMDGLVSMASNFTGAGALQAAPSHAAGAHGAAPSSASVHGGNW